MPSTASRQGCILAAIALGGGIGSGTRYSLSELMTGTLPWATFVTNVSGCLLIAVVMTLTSSSANRLVRPFWGTGVLGGYTTFSTYIVDIQHLLAAHRPIAAFGYLALTLAAALAATTIGISLTQVWMTRSRQRRGTQQLQDQGQR